MRNSLTAFVVLAWLTGLTMAQPASEPAPLPPAASPAPPSPPAVSAHAAGCCCPVCEPRQVKKKIEKVTYGVKCVEFCLPKCPGLHPPEKDCHGCLQEPPECGPMRTRKVLIKKVQVTECNTWQCTPQR